MMGKTPRDPVVVSTLVGIAAGIVAFVVIAFAVNAGSTQRTDDELLRSLRQPEDLERPIGPAWLPEVGRDLTALGGVAGLCLLTLAIAGYLLMCRKYRALGFLAAATLGGLLLSTGLKDMFSRPRPTVVPHLSYVATSSFPSGHSMLSATVYLTLGFLLASLVAERLLKVYFVLAALLLTLLVGISRVYMGVHYPTDVLAGWCAGLTWALTCALMARWLRQRGMVEKIE
jgi:undecaprenyl-diphosphatase